MQAKDKKQFKEIPDATVSKPYDYVGAIMEYESGDLDDEGTRTLFQYLVDTGLAWTLQGSYGRTAKRMLDAGEISRQALSVFRRVKNQ